MRTSEARPTVAAFGEWNTANLGDRAIYEGVVQFFERLGWDVIPVGLGTLSPVDDPAAIATTRRLDVPEGLAGLLSRSRGGARRVLRPYRQRIRARSLTTDVAGVDAALIGGGALLSDRRQHFSQSLRALSPLLRRFQIPTVCLGCSMDEEWTRAGRRTLTSFLRSCDLVAPRDSVTAERVEKIIGRRAPIFGDFALPLPVPEQRAHSGRSVALNVAAIAQARAEDQTRYEAALVSIVRTYLKSRSGALDTPAIRVFTTGTPQDTAPAERVLAQLPAGSAELTLPRDLTELRRVLRSSSIVIASRLHAAILALAEATPALGVATSAKVPRFFSTIGLEHYAFDLAEPDAVRRLTGTLLAKDSGQLKQVATEGLIKSARAEVEAYFEGIAARAGRTISTESS